MLPDAAFVAPDAPQAIPGMYGALQWFALTMRDPSEYWRGVEAARPALDRFLDAGSRATASHRASCWSASARAP